VVVKIVDPDVPPEFQAAMADILSSLPSGPGGQVVGRTRRKARLSLKKYTAREQLLAIKSACETLASRLGYSEGTPPWRAFVYAQVRAILEGRFSPEYWVPQYRSSQQIIASTPASTPDPSPPPYSYRVIDNLPTVPTYAPGVSSSGLPRYTGWRVGDYFEDKLLAWQRAIYELDLPLNDRDGEPTFFQLSGTQEMDSDRRGSRAMCSIMAQRNFAPAGGCAPFDSAVPMADALSFYWRYRAPKGEAPFYTVSLPRRIVARLYPRAPEISSAPLESLAVSVWPRAMLGRAYNNNVTVSTTLDHAENVFQLSEEIGAQQKPLIYTHAEITKAGDIHTGAESVIAPVASWKPPQSSRSRVRLCEYSDEYMTRSTRGAARGTIKLQPGDPHLIWSEGGAGPAAAGWMRLFYRFVTTSEIVICVYDRAAQLLGEISIAPQAAPWNVFPVLVGEVIAGRIILRYPGAGYACYDQGGNLLGRVIAPTTDTPITLTQEGVWWLNASHEVHLSRYGSGDSLVVRTLPGPGYGIAQYADGIYICAGAGHTGVLRSDGTLEATPLQSWTGQLSGWTLNWRP
jgi:hypothetical protein